MKLYEQIERSLCMMLKCRSKSHKWDKQKKHRVERRRAKLDPEAPPAYRKYSGHEF
jgi:hypothetical protein